MKKVSNCFVVSEIFPIFALAILEKASYNALFDIFVISGISRTLLGKYVERTCPSIFIVIYERKTI